MTTFSSVDSTPSVWPFDGRWSARDTTFVIIDMQTDFVGIGGYVDRMGDDLGFECLMR